VKGKVRFITCEVSFSNVDSRIRYRDLYRDLSVGYIMLCYIKEEYPSGKASTGELGIGRDKLHR